jgi:hypothetical protein
MISRNATSMAAFQLFSREHDGIYFEPRTELLLEKIVLILPFCSGRTIRYLRRRKRLIRFRFAMKVTYESIRLKYEAAVDRRLYLSWA